MTWKLSSLALIVALLGALIVAPLTTRAQDAAPTIDPVSVTGSNKSGNKTFDGTWTATRFVEQGGALFAEGELTGDVANKHGKVTKSVKETVLLPVAVSSAETAATGVRAQTALCDVLFLEIGPINL